MTARASTRPSGPACSRPSSSSAKAASDWGWPSCSRSWVPTGAKSKRRKASWAARCSVSACRAGNRERHERQTDPRRGRRTKMRRVLEIMLQKMGHRVLAAGNGVEALALFQANSVDLVITDLRMPEMDGIELLAALRAQASDVTVMVSSALGTIETAVAAMKHGACDYILRPFDIDVVELAVDRVLNGAAVAQQNAFLRQEIERGWAAFVGTSVS